jgi:hypothetical protein
MRVHAHAELGLIIASDVFDRYCCMHTSPLPCHVHVADNVGMKRFSPWVVTSVHLLGQPTQGHFVLDDRIFP